MFPTIKTIENRLDISRESATRVRKLMDGTLDPFTYASVDTWRRRCYNEPDSDDRYAIMLAINEEINGCGVEHLLSSRYIDDYYGHNCLEYVNMGDTYNITVCYDTERDQFLVCSYGDFITTYVRQRRGTIG